ncbi:TRAP transporter substrate-binding protein DctP [Ammoniphilus sp. YIM 78166]|uniref:TRAP transporter substrate-binding protein DctP n=1 Tax=Ammoniphilus sp. YIM 78166 TaxID=1644106 RepID=UPI0014315190|nr:TRAP transporter substrate-binding protein DctP [Ammoniphilus sp. YIM 78166]
MKKSIGMIIILSMLLLLMACSSETATGGQPSEEKITLNAVGFLPIDDPLTASLHKWVEDVHTATEGRVQINWKGAGDVIPIAQQFDALESGVIDVLFTYTGWYQSRAPEVLGIPLSQIQPWEERENGFYDFMVERHQNIGVHYIGRWLTGSPRLWLSKPIDSLDDLNGMKIRSAPAYDRLFPALGINSVQVNPADVYTSLQTKMVDGLVYGGMLGPRTRGWTDSTKYVLDHPFWSQNCTILANLDKWNAISEADRKAIAEATAEYERYMVQYYTEEDQKERTELEKAGVQFIQFTSQEDADAFLKKAYDVEWEFLNKEVPDLVGKLQSLTVK